MKVLSQESKDENEIDCKIMKEIWGIFRPTFNFFNTHVDKGYE